MKPEIKHWRILGAMMACAAVLMFAPAFGAPLWVAFSPGLFVCLAALAAASRGVVFAIASRKWPQAHGRVISSRVRERISMGLRSRHNTSSWRAVVKFEYEVNGTRYVGSGAGVCDPETTNPEDAKAFAARYRPGAKVALCSTIPRTLGMRF